MPSAPTAASTITYSNQAAWYTWTGTSPTSSTSAYQTLSTTGWIVYNPGWTGRLQRTDVMPVQSTPLREDPAEAAERVHQRIEEVLEQRQLLHNQRQNRALELLKSLLTPEQWADYTANQAFIVRGSDGVEYEIEHGTNGNVIARLEDRRVRYCAHPRLWDSTTRTQLPVPDVLAAQVLALKTDAPGFVAVANIHRVYLL